MYNPSLRVEIGDYIFEKCSSLETVSSVNSDIDFAIFEIAKAYNGKINVKKNDKVNIFAGYGAENLKIFKGIVSNVENPCRFIIADNAIKLATTRITNTFTDVTPQELVNYCLSIAGIESFVISEVTYERKESVSVCGINVTDVFKLINSLWNVEINYGFVLGTFYWGTIPAQTEMYVFEYGENIISLEKNAKEYILTTYLLPAIQHSHIFKLEHPDISGVFTAEQIRFKFDDNGFARTIIHFKGDTVV